MTKKKITVVLIINITITLFGFLTFLNHINSPEDWRFYASLVGFAIFLIFSVLLFRKLRKTTPDAKA